MLLRPYLFLDGRTEEALEFYKASLGAEVMTLTRFNDSPPDTHSNLAPDSGEKIMHAALRIGDSTILFSDGSPGTEFKGFSLALTPSNAAEAERVFAALPDGGAIQVPLAKTFFAPLFGWVTDRFGLSWMIALEP